MMGEELNASEVTDVGLLGDRVYAVVDSTDGKAASAKNPRKWPTLFDFRAGLVPRNGGAGGKQSVRITLPDGTSVTSDQADVNQALSKAFNRDVTLRAAEHAAFDTEGDWPDMDGLAHRNTISSFTMPEGTFFDAGMVHLLTTSTLDRLRELYPKGRFEPRRFRPNLIVQLDSGETGFAENAWVGRTLAIGPNVRMNVTAQCGRCVMTTLPQGDLPKDPGILRTLAEHNGANVGVYAAVMCGGTIRRGDAVRME